MERQDAFKELENKMIEYFNTYNNRITFVWYCNSNRNGRDVFPSRFSTGHAGVYEELFYDEDSDIALFVNNTSNQFYVFCSIKELQCLRKILGKLQTRVGLYSA